jgi:hypothetical protein
MLIHRAGGLVASASLLSQYLYYPTPKILCQRHLPIYATLHDYTTQRDTANTTPRTCDDRKNIHALHVLLLCLILFDCELIVRCARCFNAHDDM